MSKMHEYTIDHNVEHHPEEAKLTYDSFYEAMRGRSFDRVFVNYWLPGHLQSVADMTVEEFTEFKAKDTIFTLRPLYKVSGGISESKLKRFRDYNGPLFYFLRKYASRFGYSLSQEDQGWHHLTKVMEEAA